MTPRSTRADRPPRVLRALLRASLPLEDRRYLIDELDVLFARHAGTRGLTSARLWYLRQTAGFLLRLAGDAIPRALRSATTLGVDARIAWRSFRRRPTYALSFVLTLAIGASVVATSYGIAEWVLLRPVPGVRQPDRLLTMQLDMPATPTYVSWEVSEPDLRDLRERVAPLGRLAGMTRIEVDVRSGTADPLRVGGELVTDDYFPVLGTRMLAGRGFENTHDDTRVVISDALAHRLSDDPAALVGHTLHINGTSFTIAGVAERGFRGAELPGRADLWLPVGALRVVDPSADHDAASDRRTGIWKRVIVRPASSASMSTIEAAANVVVAASRTAFPGHSSYSTLTMRWHAFPGLGLDPGVRQTVRTTLAIISAAAAMLLVLAIANVANLALANETTRGVLAGIQRALGASRRRVASGRLIESALLGVAAALVAIGITRAAMSQLASARLAERGASLDGWRLEPRVMLFTLAITLAGAVLATAVGVALTRGAGATDLLRRRLVVGARAYRARASFVALQVALSLMLVVVAGLLERTVANLRRIDLGFRPDRITTFAIDPRAHELTGARLQTILSDVETTLASRVGGHAGFIGPLTLTSSYFTEWLYVPTDSAPRAVVGAGYYVTPGFLDAIGARVVAGTTRWQADSGTAVITRSMADSLAPHADPRLLVGRMIPRDRKGTKAVRIAAVVEDLQLSDITARPVPAVFRPLAEGSDNLTIAGFVRARRDAAIPADVIRDAVAARVPDVPVFNVLRARAQLDRQFAERTSMALAAQTLAVFGVLLAATGLYGVLSTIVVARQRELAIRMALGASAGHVRGRVLRSGLRPVCVGLVAGTLGAVAGGRVLRSQLYGLDEFDWRLYAGGLIVLVAVAVAACLIPARRATRVSPNEALRAE